MGHDVRVSRSPGEVDGPPSFAPRPLTERERSVLELLLGVEFDGVQEMRRQAAGVMVVGGCPCGCPSIDFVKGRGLGMAMPVNGAVRESYDGLFLWTIEDLDGSPRLGGIEYVGVGEEDPSELPPPEALEVTSAQAGPPP